MADLEVRPRKVRLVAAAAAVALVITFSLLALALSGDATGVYFRVADQESMVLLGVLLAAGVLLLTRPRRRANDVKIHTSWVHHNPHPMIKNTSTPPPAVCLPLASTTSTTFALPTCVRP